MSKPIYVSYSSASKFKSCPSKYYLGKRYETRLIGSAFGFGKAVESGVEALLLGKSLEDSCEIFVKKWEIEDERGTPRPIFDNLAVEYYASDFDENLLDSTAQAQIQEWADELLPDSKDKHWKETFDEVNTQMKTDESQLDENEMLFNNRVIWMCCLIRGQVMIQAFHDKLLPKLTLLEINGKPATQIETNIKNDQGDTIPGFIDFLVKHVDISDPIIIDLKTGANPYDMHTLDTSDQLRTYVAAKGAEFNTRRAGYIVLVKKIKTHKSCNVCGQMRDGGSAKNCKSTKDCKGQYLIPSLESDVQFINKEFNDNILEDVLNDYENIMVAIKNNVNFKNTKSCNEYNKKCEFYDHCWKGTPLEKIEHLKERK